MTHKSGDKREYFGVQALRAIAALAVVGVHSTDYLVLRNGSRPAIFNFPGQAGVDIFFVISGFVMMVSSGSMAGRPGAPGTFLWRRLLRIVPLYWMLTTLKLALVWSRPGLSHHGQPSAWNAIASFLFIPSRQPYGHIGSVVAVGWTLSYEMLFYLIFATSLLRRGNVLKSLIPVICVLAAIGCFRSPDWPAWTILAHPIVLEFLAGTCLGALVQRHTLSAPIAGASLMAVGFVALPMLRLHGEMGFDRPLKWGVSASLIVLGALLLEQRMGNRLPKWVLLVGDASYSIYLVQGFVLPLIYLAIDRFAPNIIEANPFEAGLNMLFFSIILCLLAGVALYRTVELPLTTYLKQVVVTSGL